jgi:hypothetical protein
MSLTAILGAMKLAGAAKGALGGGSEGGINLPKAGQLGQLGFSVGQSIMGAVKNKQADAMTPPAESAMERQMLNTIRRRRRAIETGTANAAQTASVRQMGKTMMNNAASAGGQVNYGQYNQLIGNAMGNIAAQSGQQIGQLLGQEQQQTTQMVNRATDLSLLRRNEMKADAARMQQAGSQNLLATMGAGKLEAENSTLKKKLAELMAKQQGTTATTKESPMGYMPTLKPTSISYQGPTSLSGI